MACHDGAVERLSHANANVAAVRGLARQRKERRSQGRFVVEGRKLVAELLDSAISVEAVFAEEAAHDSSDIRDLLSKAEAAGARVAVLEDGVIERLTATVSPQPIVAVASQPDTSWDALPADADFVVCVVDLNDPGNLGTLLRTASASGADAVVIAGSSVDAFSPKTVRASAGTLFDVALVVEADAEAALDALAERGLARLGTRMADAVPCHTADLTVPVAIVLGSEAHGLSAELGDRIDQWVSIPMPGRAESLNVAMAGTILVYETQRQRSESLQTQS